ncbi:MAG: glycosyltransferase [Candidatus Nanohaloarchaea archaeon]
MDAIKNIKIPDESHRTTVTYIGTVKESKDIETLVKAFEKLNKEKYLLKIIGLRNDDFVDITEGIENIELHSFLPKDQIMEQINESDIMIYTSDQRLHQYRYTSPMKLFEYMASKRPVIAADLPTTREIAGDSIWYYTPCDYQELAEKIRQLDDEHTEEKVSKAFEIVKSQYTWEDKAVFIRRKLEELDIDRKN